MDKKAKIYTIATLDSSWFLATIDIALWLNRKRGFKKININCISTYNSPFNFFAILMRLKNIPTYLNRNKLQKYIQLLELSESKNSEIANFCKGNSDHAYLTIDNLTISFTRERLDKRLSILGFIKLYIKIISDYKSYFNSPALKKRIYLNYKVDKIFAGLHILSESLRSDYKSYGSIFHCRLGILAALYKLNRSYTQYNRINLSKNYHNFVCGPDQEYLYGVFSRFMSDQGSFFIETSNMQVPYIKRELKENYYSRLNLAQIKNSSNFINEEKVFNYYTNRIQKPWEVLNYKFEKYSSDQAFLGLDGTSVIIYLHSFTDAQYVYGYDGYHDLMDWSFRTISLLNSNTYVNKIIVKPHPATNPFYHPGDVIANEYLKVKVSNFDRVMWADFHFDVNHIKSSGLVIGITHHGSVAEELVFQNFPVIASEHAPWGKKYKFGYFWEDLEEYEALISGKSITELKVTKSQTKELYRYAMDQYFYNDKETNFDMSSTWRDLFDTYDLEDQYEHGQNMQQVKEIVSNLEVEDRRFQKYLSSRFKRLEKILIKNNKY